MKKLVILLALLAALWQGCWAADVSQLIIIHTNDTHGYAQKEDGVYGMAAVAALKQAYQEKGFFVLLADAGDAVQDHSLVNFSRGASAIAFMNAAGYDVMTLGNHEFDYGQDVTLERVREARFPVVSCNIIVDASGKTFVPPRAVVQKGPVTIGIVGMTTPETTAATNPQNVYGLTFLDGEQLVEAVQAQVDYLRAAGCDVVIAVGHLGSADISRGHRADDILERVRGIDLFIDGHDHLIKNYYVNDVLLAETGSHLANIGVISFADGKWTERLLPYGAFDGEDAAVKALVDETAAYVQAETSRPIGQSSVYLDGSRSPGVRTMETNLGDFAADALLWQARMALAAEGIEVDGAVLNGGGLRRSLQPGDVSQGTIEGILPYQNQLYVMKITGQTLLELMEAAAAATPEPAGAFPQVAGMDVTVNTQIPYEKGKQYGSSKYYAPANPGRRVVITAVNGRPFDPAAVYVIASHEFICRGGDAYGVLAEPGRAELRPLGYTDTEAVMNYLRDGLNGQIGAEYSRAAGRITIR